MEQQRRNREIAYETDRLEREILVLQKSQAAKLAALRNKVIRQLRPALHDPIQVNANDPEHHQC